MSPMDVEWGAEQGPSGRCSTTVIRQEIKIRSEEGVPYAIALDHLADGVKPIVGDNLFFRLNRNEDWLKGLSPWEGNVFVRFAGFRRSRDENGDQAKNPEPYIKRGGRRPGRGGRGSYIERDRMMFSALFDIQGGQFDGVSLVKAYDYLWEPGAEGDAALRVSGKRGERLYEFLKETGFDFLDDSVPYSKNILPELETMLLKRKVIMMANIKDGWIESLSGVPDGVKPPKVAAKKTVAKKPAAKKAKK